MKLSLKLIPDWKQAHKFLSVIAAGVGAVAYTVVEIAEEAKGLGIDLPADADKWVAYVTLAAVVAGRVIKQGPAQ